MLKVISEYGKISKKTDNEIDSLSEIFVAEKTFENLKNLAFEPAAEGIFSFKIWRGKEQIQVKNYVGLLETKDGTQIEILPKICEAENLNEHRKGFLKMLKTLKNSPFKNLKNAHLQSSNLPMLEIFISQFLDEVEKLIQQGLGQNYLAIQSNENYLKGKLLFVENLKENAIRQERFFVEFDEFLADIPQNRLLKSCLQYLDNQAIISKSQVKIKQLLFIFEEVYLSENYAKDFQKTETQNRLFDRYKMALDWAKIFLLNQSFSPFSGKNLNFALLFPMEQLFENYVAAGFRKYFPDASEIIFQDSSKHLIINHLDTPQFKLRPDILVQKNDETFIFDTKWKSLDLRQKNYGIDQRDLYQMYAYGKKFEADDLFLIFPKTQNFQQSLEVFDYDSTMRLKVIPFDILGDLAEEISRIAENL